jgi:hypothetical protein
MDPNMLDFEFEGALDREFSVEEVAQAEEAMPELRIEEGEVQTEPAHEKEKTEEAAAQISSAAAVYYRRVSGRYRSCPRPWELILRVDLDGYRPKKRLSGDFFRRSGSTMVYFGSFVVHSPSISVSSSLVTIIGIATTTWATSYKKIRVRIPRHTTASPPATAEVRWMTMTNQYGARYICPFESPYFRTVVLEQDHEKGVTPFVSYNTGSLPSGGPARTLSVARAYREAGIEMVDSGRSNVVPTAPGGTWSNAELHTAMENHFHYWKDVPQWKVWLFHAMKHDYGPGLLGIMFDQKGKQRQGCAGFYQRIAGNAAANQRDQLYVCVHELGHCFNLFHSFHKKYMDPPMPNRLGALSWMNYPRNYKADSQQGEAAFWAAFPFQFDHLEIIHLRHAFYNNIVLGGNPFGKGAALELTNDYSDAVVDDSGLRLALEAPKSFAFGEPVVVEIQLRLTDLRGKKVPDQLHPNYGFVQLAIQKPGGEVIPYEPPIDHCAEVTTVQLDESRPAIYESAYIGYDKDNGQIFGQPGMYRLRGAFFAPDGSIVLSNVLNVRVRSPLGAEDEEVAELMLGDDQGMLLYLLGSDGPTLQSGNDAFEQVIDQYGKHPLAVYARMVKGFNLSREFKNLAADKTMQTRKPKSAKSQSLLTQVVNESEGDAGLDNISLNMTMRRLAQVQIEAGEKAKAAETMKQMVSIFSGKKLKSHVLAVIKKQAKI